MIAEYVAIFSSACTGVLFIAWILEMRESAGLRKMLLESYDRQAQLIDGAAQRAGVPIRKSRPSIHGENVRPDGLIERSSGEIVDSGGHAVDPETHLYGGPQAMTDG